MAASLLAAQTPAAWDIWVAPGPFAVEDIALARQVLEEIHIPLISSPQTAEPSFNHSWDEGIVLCNGAADQ
jgi:hypothetical protein